MVNKALRLVLYSIFAISLLFVVPFNIYADTISSSNVVGVNVELLGSSLLEHRTETVQTNQYNYYLNQYTYKAVIELDNSYVGVIGARVQGSYYDKAPNQGSSVRTESLNQYRKIYVNGNIAEMTFVITSWISAYDDPLLYRADGTSPYVTIEDSNVTKYEDLDSIEQIIDLLSDIYQNSNDIEGLSTNQLTELQNIVSNTSLANQYLESISKLRNYNIEMESYPFNIFLMNLIDNNRYSLYDYYNYYSLNYPIYSIKNTNYIYRTFIQANVKYWFVLGINYNIYSSSTLLNIIETNATVSDFVEYSRTDQSTVFSIVKFAISNTSNLSAYIRAKSDIKLLAIYSGVDRNNYSSDFALRYGFSNPLLDNIQLIANGTTASSSAAQSSDSANSQLQQDSNTLFTQEDSFKQNMNSAMQNIDTTFSLNNFGQSFMTSAQWVRTQYETLTNNTPFASLITFSLLVGLALIVIGKVYK